MEFQISKNLSISREDGGDIELINKYSKKKLDENEVYTFSVVLCDNDIDRDFEAFDDGALEKMKNLFLGVTGIKNHSGLSEDQFCRIYKTEVVTVPEKKNKFGRDYRYLKAWAYMLRTDENKNLISDIDGGIKKEVSVGLSVEKIECSVCGKNFGECSHIPGKIYKGVYSAGIMKNPMDAYEFSFVAVPAQKNAGVTKSIGRQKNGKNINSVLYEEKTADSEYPELLLKLENAEREIEKLRFEKARNSSADRKKLFRYMMFFEPEFDLDKTKDFISNLDCNSVKFLTEEYEKKNLSCYPQKETSPDSGASLSDYKI